MEIERIDRDGNVEFQYKLADEIILATIYSDEPCAVLRRIGPRGGSRGMITVPVDLLTELVYAIQGVEVEHGEKRHDRTAI